MLACFHCVLFPFFFFGGLRFIKRKAVVALPTTRERRQEKGRQGVRRTPRRRRRLGTHDRVDACVFHCTTRYEKEPKLFHILLDCFFFFSLSLFSSLAARLRCIQSCSQMLFCFYCCFFFLPLRLPNALNGTIMEARKDRRRLQMGALTGCLRFRVRT